MRVGSCMVSFEDVFDRLFLRGFADTEFTGVIAVDAHQFPFLWVVGVDSISICAAGTEWYLCHIILFLNVIKGIY